MKGTTIAKSGRTQNGIWSAAALLTLACAPDAHAQWLQWGGAAVEFGGTLLEFMPTRAEFAKGIIIGVTANKITDALKAPPTPPPSPSPAPNPSIPNGSAPEPRQPVPFDLCQHGGCLTLDERLKNLLPKPQEAPTEQDLRPPKLTAADMRCSPETTDPNEALRRGAVLDSGTDLPQRDAALAAGCYLIAARAKMPLAEYDLGDMLYAGDDGVPRNAEFGVGWLTRAAQAGFLPAQTYIASIYENDPTLRDPERALQWYITAAPGDPAAAYALARLDFNGVTGPNGSVMPPDYVLAFGWLQISASAGYPPARTTIQDWLAKAKQDAEHGWPQAQHVWGMAYEHGVPGMISPDPHLAFVWYQEAAQTTPHRPGLPGAARDLQRLCGMAPAACE